MLSSIARVGENSANAHRDTHMHLSGPSTRKKKKNRAVEAFSHSDEGFFLLL